MAKEPQSQPLGKAPNIPLLNEVTDAPDAIEALGHRGERTNPRSAPDREPPRSLPRGGGMQVRGRDGEILSRRRTDTGDIFDIPEAMIPQGWEYQWCAYSIVGNTEILLDQNLMMAENGWRNVPAERHPGRFMPADYRGPIKRGGQFLMERPKVLCEEARDEEYAKAFSQMRDRDESLMGRKANVRGAVGGGFELRPGTEYKGRKTNLSIDNAYDIPAPKYSPADDSTP